MIIHFNHPVPPDECKDNNNPRPASECRDTGNKEFLLSAIEAANSESMLHGAFCIWTDRDFSNQVAEKKARKKLILKFLCGHAGEASDDENPRDENDEYIDAFFKNNIRPPKYHRHDAAGFVNHNKFILFDSFNFPAFVNEVRKNSNVHVISEEPSENGAAFYLSSANVTDNGKFNASILIPLKSGEVAKRLKKYLSTILAGYEATSNNRSFRITDQYADPIKWDSFKLYLFPRDPEHKTLSPGKTKVTDTLCSVLSNVTVDKNTSIKLVFPRFRATRLDLADKLSKLASEGAKIEIISRGTSTEYEGKPEMSAEVYETLVKEKNIKLYFSKEGVNIHSKFMIIDSKYGKDEKRKKLVWHGSPNLTGGAIDARFETILRIDSPKAYEKFNDECTHLKKSSITQYEPPGS
jgi:hypothetical protein